MPSDAVPVLHRGLDQLAGLLDDVPGDAPGRPTPCEQWTLQDLVDHVVAAPSRFARMVRGEEIDWSATPSAGDAPAAEFRSNTEGLLQALSDDGAAAGPVPVDWQCAEIAVHTWDLATALGRTTADLDPAVAESGLAFMRAGLTEDNRAPAFRPERPAPDGADAFQRIAAFAGRTV
jgi:uncharacterized protein (TIGR03086 family)